ncbi:MAG: adenylate/guanylate cyclase domain-containing protein [Sneathiella sp.]|nr:adenylate/guanylate cyclase domain-containing protein [Sneathiella sp.]
MNGSSADQLIAELCERLNEIGVNLVRGNIALSTIHPQVSAFMYTWRQDEGIVVNTHVLHSEEPGEGWFSSPFFFMLNNGVNFMHRRLEGNDDLDFPVLVEFKEQGITDWFSQIFDFGWGFQDQLREKSSGLITSWASGSPGGFTKEEFALLKRVIPLFALAMKSIASFEAAETVLRTYVGRGTSQKVLAGEIKRGSAQSISAVLVFADLRGFTILSDMIDQEDIVGTLNQYLERMAEPIEDAGGEVLKFMGDGMLATFTLSDQEEADRCEIALVTSLKMIAGVKELNLERQSAGLPTMELDIALHVGEVMYGNVGSQNRLDFTVVGPAVNEVSRIESLCDAQETNLLISGEFVKAAHHHYKHLESIGFHSLRGVRIPKELFKIRDCTAFTGACEEAELSC